MSFRGLLAAALRKEERETPPRREKTPTYGVHPLLGAAVVRGDPVGPVGEHAGRGRACERQEREREEGDAEHFEVIEVFFSFFLRLRESLRRR